MTNYAGRIGYSCYCEHVVLRIPRRTEAQVAPSLLLVLLLLPLAGANLIGSGGGAAKTTSTSSYTIALTGTDSVNQSITASTTFTLTVN